MSAIAPTGINTAFFEQMKHPLKFRLFLLSKLPAAYFAGLRFVKADATTCVVAVPFKWFTKNPFGSIYFACLSMAAEMTTGALAMAAIYKRPQRISMLIIQSEAHYFKKAKSTVQFVCSEGEQIAAAVEEAIQAGTSTVTVQSKGFNKEGEEVASFSFTWSFKAN
jgi:acyl-coenzyme A thioesterase PaaI-like protein